MKGSWLKYSLLITGFGISLSVYAQGGVMDRTDRHAREFFKSRYENPVIEVIGGSFTGVFPSLTFYSVYDEENLVEDPLIPDLWVRTSTLSYFSGHDMTEALRQDEIIPRNEIEAIAIARELLEVQCDGCQAVEGPGSFPGGIPARFNDKVFFPTATKTPQGYVVSIHIFYPDSRYAEFVSLYRNNLVEYSVTNTGAEYQIREEYVYAEVINIDEVRLNEAVINHIAQKNLLNDLLPFLQKRAVYGITDPPDRAQVQRRKKELSDLWEKAVLGQHGDLLMLLLKVMEKNPDFMFDRMYIFRKTNELFDLYNIEQYRMQLNVILNELVSWAQSQ